MKSPVRLAVAALAVAAMTLGIAAPAAAQETLGFEIDPTEGFPGDIVNGQVDVADVAQHCVTDAEGLPPKFFATLEVLIGDIFVGGDDPGMFHLYFDDPLASPITIENFEQLAFIAMVVVVEQVGHNLELLEEVLPQTFVMTFADIATQEPVGEMGNFDPSTGEGSVVVPEVDPGLWAVAAACVGTSTDPGLLQDAISAVTPLVEEAWLEEWGEFPELVPPFETGSLFDVYFGNIPVARAIGEDLLAAIMEPDALGFELFDVLSDEEPPVDEPPVEEPPVDEAAAAKAVAKAVAKVTIDITITGVDPDAVSVKLGEADVDIATAAPAAAPAAQAVEAAPTFTG
jgi:hypothetical protein